MNSSAGRPTSPPCREAFSLWLSRWVVSKTEAGVFASAWGKKSRRCDCAFDMGNQKWRFIYFFGDTNEWLSLLSRNGYQKKSARCSVVSTVSSKLIRFVSVRFSLRLFWIVKKWFRKIFDANVVPTSFVCCTLFHLLWVFESCFGC